MNQVWNLAAPSTKLALFFFGLALMGTIQFLWLTAVTSGLTGEPAAPAMLQLFLGLLAVAFLQAAAFVWANSVLPGVFLSMCRAASAAGVENAFVEGCRSEIGDGYRRIAQRTGLPGLLRAFKQAQAKTVI